MGALSVREGYRLWSSTYEDETAISHIETGLVARLTPPLARLRLLDAGCGTGRRLRAAETDASAAALRVGVDASPDMLAIGQAELERGGLGIILIESDVRAMPLADAAFDVIWCRLMIGHVPDAGAVYAELARVAAPGATLIVTDFHPSAAAAGHRRSFRGPDGVVHEIEHHLHPPAVHRRAAVAAGLQLVAPLEGAIGPDVLPFYRNARREPLYAAHLGLPVVLAFAWRREK
jgi:malonyl-CoA O-methyltransferase